MLGNGNSEHPGSPIALFSRLPEWAVQSVLPIAIHRLLHRFYPLASQWMHWGQICYKYPRKIGPKDLSFGLSEQVFSNNAVDC